MVKICYMTKWGLRKHIGCYFSYSEAGIYDLRVILEHSVTLVADSDDSDLSLANYSLLTCACNLTVFFCNILFHLAERPFTRSGKALKEDMWATPPSWKEKTQPTPPDVSIMVEDSSDGSEHKNLTETNAIQNDEDEFCISSYIPDADRRDESQTVGKLANVDLLALVLA